MIVLHEILQTMGATNWNFDSASCPIQLVGGTPQLPLNAESKIECDCQHENNTCHAVKMYYSIHISFLIISFVSFGFFTFWKKLFQFYEEKWIKFLAKFVNGRSCVICIAEFSRVTVYLGFFHVNWRSFLISKKCNTLTSVHILCIHDFSDYSMNHSFLSL